MACGSRDMVCPVCYSMSGKRNGGDMSMVGGMLLHGCSLFAGVGVAGLALLCLRASGAGSGICVVQCSLCGD